MSVLGIEARTVTLEGVLGWRQVLLQPSAVVWLSSSDMETLYGEKTSSGWIAADQAVVYLQLLVACASFLCLPECLFSARSECLRFTVVRFMA